MVRNEQRSETQSADRGAEEQALVEFGERLRKRRRQIGLSVSAVADIAGISEGYVWSLEAARNYKTGRPARPSRRVMEGLSRALNLNLADLQEGTEAWTPGEDCSQSENHVLVYTLGYRCATPVKQIVETYHPLVSRWLFILDPRDSSLSESSIDHERVTLRRWELGAFPYLGNRLKPEQIIEALRHEVSELHWNGLSENVGIVIGDCSAVMGWAENPEAEVELEEVWPQEVKGVAESLLGGSPRVNVCVYHHADLEALTYVDLLATVMRLIRHHQQIIAIDASGRVHLDGSAVQTILREVRPSSVSSTSWEELAAVMRKAYDQF